MGREGFFEMMTFDQKPEEGKESIRQIPTGREVQVEGTAKALTYESVVPFLEPK